MSGRARAGVCARNDPDRNRRRRKRARGNNRFLGSFTPDGNRHRGRYFHVYRHERTAMKELSTSYCSVINNKSYRAYRFCYYVVLPTLFRVLDYPPDRELLHFVENNIYNSLVSYRFRSSILNYSSSLPKSEPTRLSFWLISDITPLSRLTAKFAAQQSSNEPCAVRSE